MRQLRRALLLQGLVCSDCLRDLSSWQRDAGCVSEIHTYCDCEGGTRVWTLSLEDAPYVSNCSISNEGLIGQEEMAYILGESV